MTGSGPLQPRNADTSELDSFLWGELRRLKQGGVLGDEVICEVERASLGANPGALIVTDHRILFHSTMLFGRRTRLRSLSLLDIVQIEVSEERWFLVKRGVLKLHVSNEPYVRFAMIASKDRAAEIARTIERQRAVLRNTDER